MLSLHPDNALDLANGLHQERVAASERARRASDVRSQAAAHAPVTVARRTTGQVLIRAGNWLIDATPAQAFARS
jgi:hypothetical protein